MDFLSGGPDDAPTADDDSPSSTLSFHVAVNGFSGPLDHLLALARAHQVDLARLSLPQLLDQLAAALHGAAPLGRKGDWVVMAAWLVQLRSALLLPSDPPTQSAAAAQAGRLRDQLLTLQDVQALAAWLERRPQLGRDVLGRGRPELTSDVLGGEHAVDVIEFLWASLALFDDPLPAEAIGRYRPPTLDLHSVPDASARIMRLLAAADAPWPLGRLVAPPPPEGASAEPAVKRRSAWTSAFAASLELAKQGAVALAQQGAFSPIHVSLAPGGP